LQLIILLNLAQASGHTRALILILRSHLVSWQDKISTRSETKFPLMNQFKPLDLRIVNTLLLKFDFFIEGHESHSKISFENSLLIKPTIKLA
jgi:hypothetical protein